jgi:hypothetical protein
MITIVTRPGELGMPMHSLLDFREHVVGRFSPHLDRLEAEKS